MAERVDNPEVFDSERSDDDSRTEDDEELDYVGFSLVPDEQTHTQSHRHVVPQLAISGLRRGGPSQGIKETPVVSESSEPCAMHIDLLSEAFCFKQELMEQTQSEGSWAVHDIVAAAFEKALNVPRHQLKFYHVSEITSPTQLKLHANKRIAVAIQSSDFSLNSLEELIQDRTGKAQECDTYRKRLRDAEDRAKGLERHVNYMSHQLKTKERENRRLGELLKQAIASQRSTSSSQLPAAVASPRLLVTGGSSQSSMPQALRTLQLTVAENTQVVSDLVQAVRTQIVDP